MNIINIQYPHGPPVYILELISFGWWLFWPLQCIVVVRVNPRPMPQKGADQHTRASEWLSVDI